MLITPDYRSVPDIPDKDQKYAMYSNPTEDLPLDVPKTCGKPIVLSHYFNANLMMHNMLSEKAVTGIIHFWNKNGI